MSIDKNSQRFRILNGFVILLVVLFSLLFIASNRASAYGFKHVDGIVYDETNAPLPGIPVVLTVYRNDVPIYTDSKDTVSGGLYVFDVDNDIWDPGDTFEVVATHDSKEASNSAVATNDEFEFYDWHIHFETAIPQFGGLTGLLISAAAIGLMAVAFVGTRHHWT